LGHWQHTRRFAGALVAAACLTGTAALAGCGGDGAITQPPPPEDILVTDPPPLYASLRSGITDEVRTVIRSHAAWQALWDQLLHGGGDVPALPAVDFATSVVVMAATGTRERAGYDINIAAWERTAGSTRVTVLSVVPPGNCPSSPVLVTPAVATAIAASAAINFVELSAEAACPP